jgi:hypothetical protein
VKKHSKWHGLMDLLAVDEVPLDGDAGKMKGKLTRARDELK